MSLDTLTDFMVTTVSDDYPTAAKLMIECLSLIPFQLPEAATRGIDVAKKYWIDEERPEAELETARVELWKYLDDRSASTDTESPVNCAIRAVICLLYPENDSDDVGDTIDFYNQMLRGAIRKESDDEFEAIVISAVKIFPNKH